MLACSDCGVERPHRVRYRNEAMTELHCTECGRTITLSRSETGKAKRRRGASRRVARLLRAPRIAGTLGAAAFGLSMRAVTKPGRLWSQVRGEGKGALKSMPRRAATKPVRLARELRADVREKVRELL